MSKKYKEDWSGDELYLFGVNKMPNHEIVSDLYLKGVQYNQLIGLPEQVRANENFFIGKQWEGVETNGLPTPQINIIKRTVGFIVSSISSQNISVNASALSNVVGVSGYKEVVKIINDEFDALFERNAVPSLIRRFLRNAAVDGDGCIYTYWDDTAETGQDVKGRIVSEIVENTRVIFGNPSDINTQSQPYIIVVKREPTRQVRLKAKKNKVDTWREIVPDYEDDNHVDDVKLVDDCTTVMNIFWKDDDDGKVWQYVCTKTSTVCEPVCLDITLYPITWLSWDYIQDSYHGQAMITGMIPNQVFINKTWAMTMLSIMKSAISKVVFDATKIKKWDNRVGAAIPINGGDVNSVAKVIDPAPVSPQVSQYIQLCVEQTESSLGATSVALGDTRPDNTSAIIALQKAASTPHELTKLNMYDCVEDLCRIYLEFMAEYYGKRYVDGEPTEMEKQAVLFAQQANPNIEMPEAVPVLFDFAEIKSHPVIIKLDVGASSYFSEIACMTTLDNLLMQGHIDIVDYLERIPDEYVLGKRSLLDKKKKELEAKQQQQAQMMQIAQMTGAPMPEEQPQQQKKSAPRGGNAAVKSQPTVKGGKGYGALQRSINNSGDLSALAR